MIAIHKLEFYKDHVEEENSCMLIVPEIITGNACKLPADYHFHLFAHFSLQYLQLCKIGLQD